MKKTLAIIFALVLSVSFAFTAFAAEYTIGEGGNAVYDTAIGYVFDIEDVDGQITGEDATVLTSAAGLEKCGLWAIWFVAEKIDGVDAYRAITDGAGMNGASPSVTLKDNQIIVVVHSSSSRPTDAETYPNWEDKVAALAVKTGDCLVLNGIDLAAGTCVNGTITVVTEDELGDVPPATESSEEDAESSEAPAESTAESVEESTAVSTEAVSDPASAEISEDSEVKSSTMEIDGEGGLGIWLYVIIGAAVVVVVAVIVLVSKKK